MKYLRLSIIVFSLLLLAGCDPYKIEVDLAPDARQELEAKIQPLKDAIENYEPASSIDATIAWREIHELSEVYQQLGEMGKAIKVYEDVINAGEKTKDILNNLGRLYEKVGEYDKAVVMYQRISDEYFDHDYLYDITWAYIRAGDRKSAEKYFNAWQLEFNKTDNQTQQAIKKLREAEKAAETETE